MLCEKPIGVFDSGLGGISVLKAIHNRLPNENLLYLADRKHAPFGTKSDSEIYALTENGVEKLIEKGAKAVVLACNTATTVAAERLRQKLCIPVIGLEPALRPAFSCFENGTVLVLATSVTLSHGKFKSLTEKFDRERIVSLSAQNIVEYVENGMKERNAVIEYLKNLFSEYKSIRFCACVLGCTHFPFVKAEITEALGYELPFFDGALGAAIQLEKRLSTLGLLNKTSNDGAVEWLTKYPNNLQNILYMSKI